MSLELPYRMQDMFAVIGGIWNAPGRTRGIQGGAREIDARIRALDRLPETTFDDA